MEIPELLPDQPFIDPSDLKGLWIPGQILHNKKLTYQEKVLVSLIWNMDQKYHCYASNKWFSKNMGIREKTIANMLTILRKKGVIKQLSWDGKIRIMGVI